MDEMIIEIITQIHCRYLVVSRAPQPLSLRPAWREATWCECGLEGRVSVVATDVLLKCAMYFGARGLQFQIINTVQVGQGARPIVSEGYGHTCNQATGVYILASLQWRPRRLPRLSAAALVAWGSRARRGFHSLQWCAAHLYNLQAGRANPLFDRTPPHTPSHPPRAPPTHATSLMMPSCAGPLSLWLIYLAEAADSKTRAARAGAWTKAGRESRVPRAESAQTVTRHWKYSGNRQHAVDAC